MNFNYFKNFNSLRNKRVFVLITYNIITGVITYDKCLLNRVIISEDFIQYNINSERSVIK